MSDRIIFHVDVNSAFVSWSAVKLLQHGAKTDYRLVPSIAAKNMDKRGSIVAAKSIPAKVYGIETGEPTLFAVRKCPGLAVLPLDLEWYKECSKNMMNICAGYSSAIQQFSIDECFIDMTNFDYHDKDKIEIAYQLKDEIRSKLGFTVNVGIGPNKVLAKMASDMSKPDKVHYLHEGNFRQFLWGKDVQDLFFCGPKSAAKLRTYDIHTIGELAKTPLEDVRSILGNKFGNMLWSYANGIDDSDVVTEERQRKSLSHAKTLDKDVRTLSEVVDDVKELCERLSRELKTEGKTAKLVQVSLKTREFMMLSKQHTCDDHISGTNDILDEAIRLMSLIWPEDTMIRQIGVGVGSLHDIKQYDFS